MRRSVGGLAVVFALSLTTPALAATDSAVTATGTGQTQVRPANRQSSTSIAKAFEAARLASIRRAIAQAHEYALRYAAAVGLRLGAVTAISDLQGGGPYGPAVFFGPFGPGKFCGTLRQPIFKGVGGHRRVVGSKKVHRCIVPPFASVTLSITYAAS